MFLLFHDWPKNKTSIQKQNLGHKGKRKTNLVILNKSFQNPDPQ